MDFSWGESEGGNYAEKEIWSALKLSLTQDEGLCFHRYPVFSADRSRREPDFLILHRLWGLYIIECKDLGTKESKIPQFNCLAC